MGANCSSPIANAAADYGVVIDAGTSDVDIAATERRRAEIRARRGWKALPKVQWSDPVLGVVQSIEPALAK